MWALRSLADGFGYSRDVAARFQVTRELPRWDTGERRWSERELVILFRCLRTPVASSGARVPHLAELPRNPAARRTVALFVADLLESHHVFTRDEVAERLTPIHRNVAQLIRLLMTEGTLAETSGGYRTRLGPLETLPVR